MALCRIYIDEVGTHDLTHADDPNQRFLSLTGVILESDYTLRVLQPEMNQLKRDFFQRDPDEPVLLHRKELVNKRPPFDALRDPDNERRFNAALLAALARWEYAVVTVVLDKQAHRDQYQTWRYHPYHYCLAVLLERFVLLLHYGAHRGDVMVESRGGKEDGKLKDSYTRLYESGTDNIPATRWQERLTSRQLKVRPKNANIAGLQRADLIAHPSRREVLLDTLGRRRPRHLRRSHLRHPQTQQVSPQLDVRANRRLRQETVALKGRSARAGASDGLRPSTSTEWIGTILQHPRHNVNCKAQVAANLAPSNESDRPGLGDCLPRQHRPDLLCPFLNVTPSTPSPVTAVSSRRILAPGGAPASPWRRR